MRYLLLSHIDLKNLIIIHALNFQQALLEPLPEIAVGSNSAKDPSWERNCYHENKSTLSAMIPANWEWFEEFKNAPKVCTTIIISIDLRSVVVFTFNNQHNWKELLCHRMREDQSTR